MRKYICLLLCSFLHGSIVFVHIGKTLPPYLDIAIEQARLFNENEDIYLIANESALEDYENLLVKLIRCEDLQKSKEHEHFDKTSRHDTKFRNGFWRFATERFFYIDELVKELNLEDVIHIESDNMIYVNFSDLMPVFRKYYSNIGAVFAADNRCIPSIMYFSNADATNHLVKFLAETSSRRWNDMYSIAGYKNRNSRDQIDYLPTVCKDYAENILKKKSKRKVQNPLNYCKNIDRFNSVFDGQAIGQYLGGQDHRNKGGSSPGQINYCNNYDPSDFKYQWVKDKSGRVIPYMIYKNHRYRINNIHVHSKDLHKFISCDHKEGIVEVKLADGVSPKVP